MGHATEQQGRSAGELSALKRLADFACEEICRLRCSLKRFSLRSFVPTIRGGKNGLAFLRQAVFIRFVFVLCEVACVMAGYQVHEMSSPLHACQVPLPGEPVISCNQMSIILKVRCWPPICLYLRSKTENGVLKCFRRRSFFGSAVPC